MDLNLNNIAWAWGALCIAKGAVALAAPAWLRGMGLRFPRNVLAGRILAAAGIAWAAHIVLHASLGRFEWIKPGIYVFAPVAFALIVMFMDELLAPRALGALLLLLSDPILDAIRWNDSPLRLVVTVLTYITLTAGMVLVLSPYYLRKWVLWSAGTDARCRASGVVLLALGTVLAGIGFAAP